VAKSKLEEIDAELAAYSTAISHADNDATFEAMAAHIDELIRERARALGLSEDEIARIEQESETAVDEQDAQAIKKALEAMPKPLARRFRRALARRKGWRP
jgi:hypothetical protein